jgi:hypothetical protein
MDVDVTPKDIARRRMRNKIIYAMHRMVDNNITFYTDVDGNYNGNYYRTYDILVDVFENNKEK